MSKILGDKSRLTCSEAARLLEEQFAEEMLSTHMEEMLHAHLDECPQCRRVTDWMSSLPSHAEKHADKRFNSGLRSAYEKSTNRIAHLRQKTYRRRIAMAIAAAAAILVAVIISQGWLDGFRAHEEDMPFASIDCPPVPPEETVTGVVMTYCEDDAAPQARTENDGDVRVRLTDGTLGMWIDPNRPNKRNVIVDTPQGEVRVKGTLFTVRVDARKSELEVYRGVVAFVPKASRGDALFVKAGQGADLQQQKVFALSSPKTTAIRRILYEEERHHHGTNQARSTENNMPETTTRETVIAFDNPASTESTGNSAPVDATASESRSPAQRAETAFSPKHDVPTIDNLIHEAQACLIARDWKCASSRYQGILQHYPKRPESTAALISLARIELRHLGMPNRALTHYRTYQKRAPKGPMAEEALFGIAETYRRLGQATLEQETLRQFIEQFPQSSQIKRAHTRLRRLGGE